MHVPFIALLAFAAPPLLSSFHLSSLSSNTLARSFASLPSHLKLTAYSRLFAHSEDESASMQEQIIRAHAETDLKYYKNHLESVAIANARKSQAAAPAKDEPEAVKSKPAAEEETSSMAEKLRRAHAKTDRKYYENHLKSVAIAAARKSRA